MPVTDVCMSSSRKRNCSTAWKSRPAVTGRRRTRRVPAVREALDLTDEAAIHYAEIRADLKKRGRSSAPTTCSLRHMPARSGLTLVTNNTAEFERVRISRLRTGR